MKKKVIKKFTKFRPRIRSRHPSHNPLRNQLPLLPFRSIVRLGSVTVDNDIHAATLVECNSVQSIKNSANKLLMKQCFTQAGVKTAKWCKASEEYEILENGIKFLLGQNDHEQFNGLEFPMVAKSYFGSRGQGNTLIKNKQEFENWLRGKNLNNYILEKFYNYSLEYRLHITKNGYFYTCRKALKQDVPEDQKWRRHDDICVWFTEDNADFKKPNCWNLIVEHCVKALNSLGLDIGCFDVKVQSAVDNKGRQRQEQDFIILESNSAPSFGDLTLVKYLEEIPKILKQKKNYNGRLLYYR